MELVNLEELNLVELNNHEAQEIEGGFGPLFYALAVFGLGVYNGYNATAN